MDLSPTQRRLAHQLTEAMFTRQERCAWADQFVSLTGSAALRRAISGTRGGAACFTSSFRTGRLVRVFGATVSRAYTKAQSHYHPTKMSHAVLLLVHLVDALIRAHSLVR